MRGVGCGGCAEGEHLLRCPLHVGGGDVKSGEAQRERADDHQKQILRTTAEARAVGER